MVCIITCTICSDPVLDSASSWTRPALVSVLTWSQPFKVGLGLGGLDYNSVLYLNRLKSVCSLEFIKRGLQCQIFTFSSPQL